LTWIQGWGIAPPDWNQDGDAIKNAKTPVMDNFEKTVPFCELEAHGIAVGLPEDLMGNSEGDIFFLLGTELMKSRTLEYRCWKDCLAGIPILLISG